ncbi:tetratricopeptide repeat protein [Deinococcus ficus]|uniref:tetratricopeptide repeat protein n=1 Tax=Deinococcus ficus TaxID=317577 RepID=UPI0003B78513|nr:tetratricopeptide repeat protein [Deinococcus ficus]
MTEDSQTSLTPPLEYWLDAFRQVRRQPLEALKVLEQALQAHPEEPSLWVRQARIQMDLRAYDEAEWAAWQATQLDETDFESWYVLGMVREARGKIYEAIAAHEQLLAIAPGDPDALGILAHDLAIAGEPGRALPLLEALHAQSPEVTKVEVGLGRALLGVGRLTEAQVHLDHVISVKPQLSEARVLSAQVQNLLLRRDAWIEQAHQAYALRPDLPANIQWQARALAAEEKAKDVLELLLHGTHQNPEAYLLSMDLSRVIMNQGEDQQETALALLTRAAELAPFHGEVIAEQARIACALHQPVDWAALIARAEAQPFNHRLAIRAGKLCLEFGDAAEGLRLLALGTEGTEDIEGLTALGHGLMAEARFQEAHEVLQRAVSPNVDRPETDQAMASTWRGAALAAYASDQNELARQAFERALPWHEHDLQLWYAFGLLMFELEEWTSARQAFEHVLAQDPEHTEARRAYQALQEKST